MFFNFGDGRAVMHRVQPYKSDGFYPYLEAIKNNQRNHFEEYNRLLFNMLQFNELDWLVPMKAIVKSKPDKSKH